MEVLVEQYWGSALLVTFFVLLGLAGVLAIISFQTLSMMRESQVRDYFMQAAAALVLTIMILALGVLIPWFDVTTKRVIFLGGLWCLALYIWSKIRGWLALKGTLTR
jgi:uncharacterized membrane protein YhaH (DUF805 family)